jgi:hypothetical protein
MPHFRAILFAAFMFILNFGHAQIYLLPFDRISQLRQDRAGLGTQPSVHQAAKPILYDKANVEGIAGLGQDTTKYYYLVTEKLFSEHLIELDKKDFKLYADFLFNFGFGAETVDEIGSEGRNTNLFQNTRGFQIQGQVGESVFFLTDFRENQGRYPSYINQFIDSLGVMPGSGRVKEFRDGGYDYSMASGLLGIDVKPWLKLSLGHFKQFIGHGYRSLLLSDNAHNYPFASYDLYSPDGKVAYRYTLALLQDLERLPAGETPESIFQRKSASWNYLSFKPLKNLEIGFFEQVIWKIYDDSLGSQPFDYRALLPVPGLNAAILGLEDEENNAILGFNLAWYPFEEWRLYSQVLIDNNRLAPDGYQFGWRWSGILDRFDFQVEYNRAEAGAGTSPQSLQSADHFNQPLAHVLGRGFEEWVGILTYYRNRIYLRAKAVWFERDRTNTVSEGPISSEVLNGDLRIGYIFNPSCNIQLYSGYNYRSERIEEGQRDNGFWYIGVRTGLSNIYTDF